jgi:hypothetical protein
LFGHLLFWHWQKRAAAGESVLKRANRHDCAEKHFDARKIIIVSGTGNAR